MYGAFGRFIAIVLLVALIILLPLGFLVMKTEKAENVYVREIAERFYEEMMADKELAVEEWEKFLQDIEHYGEFYEVEVSVGKPAVWYVSYSAAEDAADKLDELYTVTYGQEFLECLYRDKVYYLQEGDAVTVAVRKKRETGLIGWLNWLFGSFGKSDTWNFGGVVGK